MATKSATVRARMEPRLKQQAEAILDKLGLSVTDALALFYKQVVLHKGIPFELRVPNKETREAMEDARLRRNLKTYKDIEEFRKSLGL